jgi:hypothetical protein
VRLGFLIFSAARAIFLSAIYMGFHCCAPKNPGKLVNTMHVVRVPSSFSSSSFSLILLYLPFPLPSSIYPNVVNEDISGAIHNILDNFRCPDPPNVGLCRVRKCRRSEEYGGSEKPGSGGSESVSRD